ncbi:PAS domain S-box protein [Leptolyngbya sp. FACHB-261]|uniref:PAS domain S-box protein n=1 Tax=Leptolyngbya sp. FACHB-261 TaxID=2692806 RepID=UPI001684E279|nr:PAS domain S-box protein [Leptolyngbya sp. FACHB-261]MBD2100589.1 PAS domain S-box protein [Leptolyngbya sp. FACHB-261]
MNLKTCTRYLSAALNRGEEPDVLFQTLTEELYQALKVDRCTLWCLEAEQWLLRWEAHNPECSPPWRGFSCHLHQLKPWPGYARLLQGQVLHVSDQMGDRHLLKGDQLQGHRQQAQKLKLPLDLEYRGYLLVPIFAKGQLVGLLGLFQVAQPLHCTRAQISNFKQLAELAGIAFIQAESQRVLSQAQAEVEQEQSQQLQLQTALRQEQTERQRLEDTLRESEARLLTLVENLPFDCWVCDVKGRYLLQNASDLEHWGDLTGGSEKEGKPSETPVQWQNNHRRAMAGEVVWDEAVYPVRGELRTFFSILAPVRQGDEIRGILGVSIDITERKQAEEALLQAKLTQAINQQLKQEIVDREQAEEALRQSEARYRAIVEDQSELICRYLPNTTLTFVNGSYCRYFGQPRESLLGQSFLQFVPEQGRAGLLAYIASFNPQRPVSTYEHEVLGADGKLYCQQWIDRAIFDEQGHLLEIQSVGRDISAAKQLEAERRQAAEALRQSEARYRAIVEEQTEMICRYLPDTTLTFVNEVYCRYFDRSSESLLGQSFLQFIPEQEHAAVRAYVATLSSGQPASTYEHYVLGADGEFHWQHWTDRAIFDEQGHLIEVQCVGRDITAAKQLEAERKRTEEQMRLLQRAVEQSLDAVLITEAEPLDPPGPRILFVNSAFTKITGYTAAEALGQSPRFLQGLRTDRRELDRLRVALEAWQPATVELLNYRKDGSEFWVELNLVPIADAEGWYTHWLSIQRDITERKRTEALEQTNRELQVTNANLSRLEKLKSQLVATVSHEIRMPITTLHTAFDALNLMLPELPAKAETVVKLAHGESLRLVRLVNDLLDFSQLDAGTYRWQDELVDLNTVLTRSVLATQALYERFGLSLVCSLPEPGLQIWGDGERLVQVVVNLLDNAAKFSPPAGRVELTLSSQGAYALVAVRDQGPGIAPEHREAIFELFNQLGPSKQRPKGIGLGLHLCRQIVHHHGGKITVETQPNQGSTFKVLLPLQKYAKGTGRAFD